jgi:foldase protein PrsA
VNNSKKLKTQKVKVSKKDHQKKPISKMWIITSIVLIVVLLGAVTFDQLYKKTILTINDEKYTMEDLSYYFYTVESQYDYYDQMFGGQYWDMAYNTTSNLTMRDVAKQEALENAIFTEVLYKEAIAAGYSLTEEEKETIKKDITTILEEQLPVEIQEKNNFDEKSLTNIMNKTTLVSRYRQDKIDALDINDEEITSSISRDNYRQYDIEYIFLSTKKTDDQGTSTDMSEDEKAVAYSKISGIYAQAEASKDWSTLIPEDETELTYQEDNFIESDNSFSAEMKTMMVAMENGDLSEIYEAENGYYIVRMINNNSSEAYDNAVKQAITDAETEGFNKIYDDILKNYTYKTNESALKSMRMGTITLIK